MMRILLTCSKHFIFFFFNDTATTEIYTLSLHDALPISSCQGSEGEVIHIVRYPDLDTRLFANNVTTTNNAMTTTTDNIDRKSTRLNSSHANISYAVFCLKKKKK